MAAKESQILRATKNNLESIQREAQSLKIDELNFIARRKLRRKIKRQKRLSRSLGGDIALFTVLFAFGLFSAYPLVFTISNAFKPLDEIFIFPPKLFPRSFTFDNFIDLFKLIGNSRFRFRVSYSIPCLLRSLVPSDTLSSHRFVRIRLPNTVSRDAD